MSEDRMRAEFELWWRRKYNSTLYCESSWRGWQASRAALEIDLPKPVAPDCPEGALDDSWMDGYNAALRMRESCVNSIESAGVRVKK